jgi:DnaJ-class molecular chaperone
LKVIGKHLQISTKNFNYIKSKFIKDDQKVEFIHDSEFNQEFVNLLFKKDNSWAYNLLGLMKNATNEQIKKTYHQLAFNFHPDKLSGSSETEQKEAERKFQEITEAYEIIKNERGIA